MVYISSCILKYKAAVVRSKTVFGIKSMQAWWAEEAALKKKHKKSYCSKTCDW